MLLPFLPAREGPCQCFRLGEIACRVQEKVSRVKKQGREYRHKNL